MLLLANDWSGLRLPLQNKTITCKMVLIPLYNEWCVYALISFYAIGLLLTR